MIPPNLSPTQPWHLTSVTLYDLLSRCNTRELLQLRITNCIIDRFTPASMVELVKMMPGLSLLTIDNVKKTSYASELLNIESIKLISPRCAKMLEYAQSITWLDLMTLDRDQIQRRIAMHARITSETTAETIAASSSSSTFSSSSSSPASLNDAVIRWSGCEWWQDWQRLQQMNQLEAKLKLTPDTTSKKKKKQQIFKSPPAPRLVGIEPNPGPWSIIPLDCLALCAQYLCDVLTHTRLHRVSRHWRQLLRKAGRYSHAYSTVGFVLPLRWSGANLENCSYYDAKSEWKTVQDDDFKKRRPLGLVILSGLQFSFPSLRILSLNLEFSRWTTPLVQRVKNFRASMYELLSSLVALECLSLCDLTRIEGRDSVPDRDSVPIAKVAAATFLSHTELAESIAHMIHLREFHYDIRVEGWDAHQYQRQMTFIPDSLVQALTNSKGLKAIGGALFVQGLTERQWVMLFSELEELESVSSLDRTSMDRLHDICTTKVERLLPAYSVSIPRIRCLRLLQCSSHTRLSRQLRDGDTFTRRGDYLSETSVDTILIPLNFYARAVEIGCEKQIRTVLYHTGRIVDYELRFDGLDLAVAPTMPLISLTIFENLFSLSIDMYQRDDYSPFEQLADNKRKDSKSLKNLHELTFYNLQPEVQFADVGAIEALSAFLSSLAALRCFTLTSLPCDAYSECTTNVTSVQLYDLLSHCNCKKLLELRLMNSIIQNLSPESIVELMKLFPSLHLLTLSHIKSSSQSSIKDLYSCKWMDSTHDELDSTQLAKIAPKCGKMIEYARCINWIDLMLRDKDWVRQRLVRYANATEAATEDTSSSSSSSASTSSLTTSSPSSPISLNAEFIRWSGCEWWKDWQRQQQIDQLEVKLKSTPVTTKSSKT